jgi:hypothetical protein
MDLDCRQGTLILGHNVDSLIPLFLRNPTVVIQISAEVGRVVGA